MSSLHAAFAQALEHEQCVSSLDRLHELLEGYLRHQPSEHREAFHAIVQANEALEAEESESVLSSEPPEIDGNGDFDRKPPFAGKPQPLSKVPASTIENLVKQFPKFGPVAGIPSWLTRAEEVARLLLELTHCRAHYTFAVAQRVPETEFQAVVQTLLSAFLKRWGCTVVDARAVWLYLAGKNPFGERQGHSDLFVKDKSGNVVCLVEVKCSLKPKTALAQMLASLLALTCGNCGWDPARIADGETPTFRPYGVLYNCFHARCAQVCNPRSLGFHVDESDAISCLWKAVGSLSKTGGARRSNIATRNATSSAAIERAAWLSKLVVRSSEPVAKSCFAPNCLSGLFCIKQEQGGEGGGEGGEGGDEGGKGGGEGGEDGGEGGEGGGEGGEDGGEGGEGDSEEEN